MNRGIIILLIVCVCCVCISISIGGGIALSTPKKKTTTAVLTEETEETTTPAPTTTLAPTTTPAPIIYKNLCNTHNKCLAVPNNLSEAGHNLIQWDKSNEEGQLWAIDKDGYVCNKHNQCVTSPNGNNGTNIYQAPKSSTEIGQKWSFRKVDDTHTNLCNGYDKCLSASQNGSNNGRNIIQWSGGYEQGQNWSFA